MIKRLLRRLLADEPSRPAVRPSRLADPNPPIAIPPTRPTLMWSIDARGIDVIKHFESLHDGDLSAVGLQPKLCPAGVWTVGWGRAVIDPQTRGFLTAETDPDGSRARALYPALTEAQADVMLAEDTERFARNVDALLRRVPTPAQRAAMVSLAYNVGVGRPGGADDFADSTVLREHNAGNHAAAADAFRLWDKARQGGKLVVMPGLVRRRQAERELYLSTT